jgi:hypothetical protein
MKILRFLGKLTSVWSDETWVAYVTQHFSNSNIRGDTAKFYLREITRKLNERPDDPLFGDTQLVLKVSDSCYVLYHPSPTPKTLQIGRRKVEAPFLLPVAIIGKKAEVDHLIKSQPQGAEISIEIQAIYESELKKPKDAVHDLISKIFTTPKNYG